MLSHRQRYLVPHGLQRSPAAVWGHLPERSSNAPTHIVALVTMAGRKPA